MKLSSPKILVLCCLSDYHGSNYFQLQETHYFVNCDIKVLKNIVNAVSSSKRNYEIKLRFNLVSSWQFKYRNTL